MRRVGDGHSAYEQVVDVWIETRLLLDFVVGRPAVDGSAAGDFDIVPAADADERLDSGVAFRIVAPLAS